VTDLLEALLVGRVPESIRGGWPRDEDGTYPVDLEVDEHGYPSDEKVEEIGMVSLRDARRWMHDEFPRLWGTVRYGHVEVEDEGDALRVYVATGGWSGCEDVIEAVLGHLAMRSYCRERRSGGGFTFRVPHEVVP
jgi:hypothetical protein